MLESVLSALVPKSMQAKFLLSQVKVAHVNEGRIRVIYDKIKHDDEIYLNICDNLKSIDEITEWKVNRVTGSVTIHYDPQRIIPGSFFDQLLRGARAKINA